MLTWVILQIGFFVGVFSAPLQEPYLDLSRFTPPEQVRTRGWIGGGIGGGIGRPQPTAPLQIELLALDRSRYGPGDRFVYDVRIRNVGNREALVPWDPDWTNFQSGPGTPPPIGFRTAYLTVRLKDSPMELRELSDHALFGSPELEGSLLSLHPGQSARIRGKGEWDFLGSRGEKVEWEPPTRIQVEAVLDFTYGSPTGDYSVPRRFESKSIEIEFIP